MKKIEDIDPKTLTIKPYLIKIAEKNKSLFSDAFEPRTFVNLGFEMAFGLEEMEKIKVEDLENFHIPLLMKQLTDKLKTTYTKPVFAPKECVSSPLFQSYECEQLLVCISV